MIILREVDRNEWNTLWLGVVHANLLQSWEYGEAKSKCEWWKPVRFVICEDGNLIGIMQVLVRSLPVIGGIARLNRGPLYLNSEEICSERIAQLMYELKRECRRRHWWRLYIAPELEKNKIINEELFNGAVRFLDKTPWASARLSIYWPEEIILKNLNGKWRNLLRKSQKSGLSIVAWDGCNSKFSDFLNMYNELQEKNKFKGVSNKLLIELACQATESWAFMLFFAVKDDDEIVGSVATIAHGDTATYLIGTTNANGRNCCANYFLLWNAILEAKKMGCSYFDLGGLNSNTPLGVSHFKLGLNAIQYELIGELCL